MAPRIPILQASRTPVLSLRSALASRPYSDSSTSKPPPKDAQASNTPNPFRLRAPAQTSAASNAPLNPPGLSYRSYAHRSSSPPSTSTSAPRHPRSPRSTPPLRSPRRSSQDDVLAIFRETVPANSQVRETVPANSHLMQHRIQLNKARNALHDAAVMEELEDKRRTDEWLRQMPLRFHPGDVYAPHDLTPGEQRHYQGGKRASASARGKMDMIERMGMRPLDWYRNQSLISYWTTPMGFIRHSNDTGYSPVNQRKMAKAVRRAIGLALYPSSYPHPELMRAQMVDVWNPHLEKERNKGRAQPRVYMRDKYGLLGGT